MLKPFHIIDCPDDVQSIIQRKVLEYLKDNTDLLNRTDLQLWNKVDTLDLVRAVPELVNFYRSIGLRLREVAITVVTEYKDAGLHIDELPVTAKINFPIQNTEHTYNEWYEVSKDLIETVTPIINKFGATYYNLDSIDLIKCKKIGEFELLKPVVFNSQLPHKIRITEQAILPRIVLACTFFEEPIHLLKPVSTVSRL